MLSEVRLKMAFPACKSLSGPLEISYRVSGHGTNTLQYTWLSARLKYRGQFLVNTKDSVLKGNWKIYGMNDRNCLQKAKYLFLCPISRASKSEVQECPTDHKEILSDGSTPLSEDYPDARKDALCLDKEDEQNSDPLCSRCCPSIFLHTASGSCPGLVKAAKYACNDAKYMNERARNDIVLLSRGITKLNDRARQDVAILGLEFLKLDARARENTGKIDSNVKQKAAYLQRIAEVLTDKAQIKLKTAAAKHWNDGALEADLRRVDLHARRRAMEDALMALEFVKNVHDMMVRTMYQVPGNAQNQGEKNLVEGLTIEKKGKAFKIFPGKVSDDQITAIQDAYWSMASALEEADGIDYTNPDDLELLVATLLDMDAIDGKSGASLLAECSRSPDVGTRQALANALADAPSMWTLGNAGMGALQRLARDSNPAVGAAASKAIEELRRQWRIEEGDTLLFSIDERYSNTDSDEESDKS